MYKITTDLLLKIDKTLKRADKAINILERGNSNRVVFPELKKDMQSLIEELDTKYALLEFEDINARDETLKRKARESEIDWKGRKIG